MAYGLEAEQVGRVAVVDVETACEPYGLDALPSPLGRTRPVGSMWLATRGTSPVEDRLADGDLRGMRPWIESLVRADVRIACRTSHREPNSLDFRLHATRTDEHGFLAIQRRDVDGVDVVDLYETSPDDLGHAVTDALGTIDAGLRWRIRVADSESNHLTSPEPDAGYDDFGFPIPQMDVNDGSRAVVISDGDVLAAGTIAAGTEILRWVHVRDDGAYLFEAGESDVAEPIDAAALAELVDGLIDHAVAAAHWDRRIQH